MSIVDKVKDVAESKSSHELSDEAKEAKSALSKSLGNVPDLGMDGMEAFLKTAEGKKLKMQLMKYYVKKYWWALGTIAAFDLIGIFATVKYSISKR